ncbi:MAG: hypothetical protein ACLFSQ_10555 [Candidatus Zixiibacteriota bacterium]
MSANLSAFDADLFVKKSIESDENESPEKISYLADETTIQYHKGDFSNEIGRHITKSKYFKESEDKIEREVIEEETIGEFDLDRPNDDDDEDSDSDNDGNGRMSMSTAGENFPFSEDGFTIYDFEYIGTKNYNGEEAYEISFEPLKSGEDYIKGKALFTVKDSLFRRIEFTMSKKMTGMKHFEMAFNFDYIDNYRVPSEVYMKMHIKVILLINKSFEVKHKYYNFKINS